MSFVRGELEVEPVGTALWLGWRGQGTLIDCPDGTGKRLRRAVQRVWLTNGRLERVAGLPGLLERHGPLECCFPLSDPRAADLAEAVQRGWQGEVVLDALQPGGTIELEGLTVRTLPLASSSPSIGLRFEVPGTVVVYLPRCSADAAARRLCKHADLVVLEGLSNLPRLELGEQTEVWGAAMAEA